MMEFQTMFAASMDDRAASEVGDSVAYNQLQLCRAVRTRRDPTAEAPIGTASELLRVLIVDDYRDAADTLAMLVGAWEHDVRRAYDGTSALALAATYRPHVLLLDIAMPDMSGPELAVRVRQKAELKDCFMIAITGYTDSKHRRQCEEAGIDLFLIKPVDPSILHTLLVLESEYVSRSWKNTPMYEVLSTMARQLKNASSLRPTQLPFQILPEPVVS
jgi:two-component system CheB/CheR fusion protein